MELKVICKKLITQNLDGNITEGEYGADVVGISVPRMYGEHDLSAFSFRLTAVSKLNESVAEQVLTMNDADDESIHLLWEVNSDFTASSGEVTLILAGVNVANTVQIKFISQPVTINDDCRLDFIESPTILEQAYNQVQLEVQKAIDAAERAEEAASKPIIVPVAAETEIGGIISGGDISVAENGAVTINSVNGQTIKSSVPEDAVFTDTVYTLPTASENILGGVKIDNNTIKINSNGIIYATGEPGVNGYTLNGDSSYNVQDTVDYSVMELNMHGKSEQNGTPTPDVSAPIISVGNNGTLTITTDNNNDISLSATITSGLPLCSIDDIYDELIYNADGTGKIIKRTASVTFDGSQTITLTTINNTQLFAYRAEKRSAIKTLMCNCFTGNNLLFSQNNTCGIDGYTTYFRADGFSTVDDFKTFAVSNNLTIVYQIETPYEIELSAAEMSDFMRLQTFNGVTNIYNDADAEMRVKVATNPLLSEFVKPIINGITARYEARIAALEAAVTSNT